MEDIEEDEAVQQSTQTCVVTHSPWEPESVAPRVTNSPDAVEQLLQKRIDKFLAGYGLTPMGKAVALRWIKKIGADSSGEYARVRAWLLGRLNAFARSGGDSSTIPVASPPSSDGISPWQRGCPELIPGLRSKAFWEAQDLPCIVDFEKGFQDALEELLALKGRGGFQPYRAPRRHGNSMARPAVDGVGSHCHDGGEWNVFYMFLHNVDFARNRSICPKTCALVEALPRHYHHSFFSALAPGTHVVKHNGPTNKKLRIHLPLLAPGGGLSRLRVGSETRETCAGRALAFDDSFEHEAWNDGHCGGVMTRGLPLDGRLREGRSGWNRRQGEASAAAGGGFDRRDHPSCQGTAGEGGEREEYLGVKPAPRVTLIADVWHPDLSSGLSNSCEVRFLAFLQQATLRLEKCFVETKTERIAMSVDLRSFLHRDGHHPQSEQVELRPPELVSEGQLGTIALLPRPTSVFWDKRRQLCRDRIGRSTAETENVSASVTTNTTASARNMSNVPDTPPNIGREGGRSVGGKAGVGCPTAEGAVERREEQGGHEEKGSSPLVVRLHRSDYPLVQDREAGDNFLGVINRARQLRPNESSIFGDASHGEVP